MSTAALFSIQKNVEKTKKPVGLTGADFIQQFLFIQAA